MRQFTNQEVNYMNFKQFFDYVFGDLAKMTNALAINMLLKCKKFTKDFEAIERQAKETANDKSSKKKKELVSKEELIRSAHKRVDEEAEKEKQAVKVFFDMIRDKDKFRSALRELQATALETILYGNTKDPVYLISGQVTLKLLNVWKSLA